MGLFDYFLGPIGNVESTSGFSSVLDIPVRQLLNESLPLGKTVGEIVGNDAKAILFVNFASE